MNSIVRNRTSFTTTSFTILSGDQSYDIQEQYTLYSIFPDNGAEIPSIERFLIYSKRKRIHKLQWTEGVSM